MRSRSRLEDVVNSATRYSDMETVGIANAMERIGEAAPALIEMQSALLAGITRSHRQEAERMATLGDSLQSAAAGEQADRFEGLHREFAGLGSAIVKIVEGQAEPGSFHGFVFTAEGIPAVGYRVELSGLTRRAVRANTDETGYFRMTIAGPGDARAAEQAASRDAEAAGPFSEEATSVNDGNAAKAEAPARVTVSNPSGRLLFSDPTPPTASESGSIFRYYPLPPERSKPSGKRTNRADTRRRGAVSKGAKRTP